ncbi:hypothetical protein Cni_G25199 [Canna indica]|uniref:Phorbol-ester/DAG-type domain-containing protein n=1 Tax=Canna indica TaxID=4628 RepID=A0AAQ3L3V7_9LILI|nr:hypothetical protein Cni_G25199 [Canna indica]
MTTPAGPKRDLRPAGCGGDGCGNRDPWLLHHVRHRTVFCRLCTTCVLRYHPGSFCATCFALLLDGGASPVVRCSRCPSVAHTACLPDPAAPFVCPSCSDSGGSSSPYFALGSEKTVDLKSGKVHLAAAQLAAASIGRAVVSARADTERKVREAAVAKKRAREALERVLLLSQAEKELKKKNDANLISTAIPKSEVMDQKKKMPKLSSTVVAMVAQKRIQIRERDRWMKFQEPIGMAQTPAQCTMEDKNKVEHANNVEKEGRLSGSPHASNPKGQVETDERGDLKGSQGGLVKDD